MEMLDVIINESWYLLCYGEMTKKVRLKIENKLRCEYKCDFLLFFLRFDINDFYFSFLSSQKMCYLKFVLRFLCFSTKKCVFKMCYSRRFEKNAKNFSLSFSVKKK